MLYPSLMHPETLSLCSPLFNHTSTGDTQTQSASELVTEAMKLKDAYSLEEKL